MKMFGLAALAAVASMAMLGAGTASAGPTALCSEHKDPCPEAKQLESVHFTLASGTVSRLLSSLATILCLEVLAEGDVEGEASNNPLPLEVLLAIGKCGSNAAHSNCNVTVLETPLALLLRTALNLGDLSGTVGQPGIVNLSCTILGITVNCDYSGKEFSFPIEGALHSSESTGHGMITATEAPAKITQALGGAGFLCPENSTLDFLLEPLAHTYIASDIEPEESEGTALCKAHSSTTCPEKDLVEEAKLESTGSVVLLNSVANIECDASTLKASLLGLGTEVPQKGHVSEWTWGGCHTLGATGNCSVETVDLPEIEIERDELNLATVIMDVEFAIECLILGLHEMSCSYGGTIELELEGALRKAGTGHGQLEADQIELERIEKGTGCAASADWDASYEPSQHVYVVA